ncbi:MAG TPA: flagellar basal-body MS-ring/collar protein FliF [Opitutaceae bacterium]|nr:flagellar basal-body MS-ring/collar protein FliF [Opitutaceae bacterium]
MKNFATSLLALWKQLGLNQRVSLIVTALAVAGGLTALVLWAQRPEYKLLYTNLGDKDSAAIISYLQSQNIKPQVSGDGSAVSVPSDQVYKLRMDLAAKGLPGGDGVGFEIFDKGQFGLSDFVQRTNYLRAIQGELARTISQLQGVRAARVLIVQPENRLLLTDQSVKSTASVFVDLGGSRLELEQVNAIRHLVANAVQGLVPDQVAVIDNHGRTLSEELKSDPALGTASSQIKYKQQVEDYLAKKVESMLAPVIGEGNAVVRVSADIDTEASTVSQEKYDPDGAVVRSQTKTKDSSNSVESRSNGGTVGISANVPDKAAVAETNTTRPTSSSDQDRENLTTTYEIGRTVTNITRNPGTVRSVTAAVLIAPRAPATAGAQPVKRTAEELSALRQIVINALGLKAAPGQSLDSLVTVDEMPFAPEPEIQQIQAAQNSGKWIDWVDAARRWGAVVGAAVMFLIFLRMLSKQRIDPVPVEVLSLPPDAAARALPSAAGVTPEVLNDLIRQRPANVGASLRDWVAANKN